MYIVYALVDPQDQKAWYVGITNDLERRYISHLRCMEENEAKNKWIDSLKSQGYLPIMQTLEKMHSRSQAVIREVYWINHFNHLRMPLTNIVGPSILNKPFGTSKPSAKELVHELIKEQATINYIIHQAFPHRRNADAINELRSILASFMPLTQLDDPIAELIRKMIVEQKGVNEIVSKAFPNMRNADALTEYRRYMAFIAQRAGV